ncbi:hypothetical protein [Sediminibacillus massiliensis]|uniref:hypothetical protein n=1 Tax=Sediminibacillus massiliensis TaxID=1926277 RepID=UPI0009884849|nr:hypothetical protein [Sediminibacillus massiliensis]
MTELRENEDGSFLLEQYHCPIRSIASNHKDICTLEAELFESLIDGSYVSMCSFMTVDSNCCSFLIGKRKAVLK